MEETGFVPNGESAELLKIARGVLLASADFMRAMVTSLPETRRSSFLAVLNDGGRIGVEFTVDGEGSQKLALVGIANDGQRMTAAEFLLSHDSGHRFNECRS